MLQDTKESQYWYQCNVRFTGGCYFIITARVRSMTGGYVFTGVCLLNFWGYPIQLMGGGTLSQVWMGVPNPASGGTPSQVWTGGTPSSQWGVPHPRSGWGGLIQLTGGTSSQIWMRGTISSWWGVPYLRSRWGYPISGLDRGVPLWPGLDGVPPWPGLDGVPPSGQDWMGYPLPPSQNWMGYPLIRQSSIVSTCYVAGGMPLAFTQQDFLVSSSVSPPVRTRNVWIDRNEHRQYVKCVGGDAPGSQYNVWVSIIVVVVVVVVVVDDDDDHNNNNNDDDDDGVGGAVAKKTRRKKLRNLRFPWWMFQTKLFSLLLLLHLIFEDSWELRMFKAFQTKFYSFFLFIGKVNGFLKIKFVLFSTLPIWLHVILSSHPHRVQSTWKSFCAGLGISSNLPTNFTRTHPFAKTYTHNESKKKNQ